MVMYDKGNKLIIIEEGKLSVYPLDEKETWEIGRPSKNSNPDIKLHSTTVSRRHGSFQNTGGIWFYLDNNSKNGTICNQKYIYPGLGGRIRPVMLKDGDVFIFGEGKIGPVKESTILGVFTTKDFNDSWRIVDTSTYRRLRFTSGGKSLNYVDPEKGKVINEEKGIAIYMGDWTYMIGDMQLD